MMIMSDGQIDPFPTKARHSLDPPRLVRVRVRVWFTGLVLEPEKCEHCDQGQG